MEWCACVISVICDKNGENQNLLNNCSYVSTHKNTEKILEKNFDIKMFDKSVDKSGDKNDKGEKEVEKEGERRSRRGSLGGEHNVGMCELLVQSLNNHKNNSAVILQLTRAVRTFANEQKNIQTKFSEENIVFNILKILKIHSSNELICENIGWILTNFTVPNYVNNAISVISSGGGNTGNTVKNEGVFESVPLSPNTTSSLPLSNNYNNKKAYFNRSNGSYDSNKNLIYCDTGNWSLIVSCIEQHIIKGKK